MSAEMPSTVEDFQHPGAANILRDRKVELKQGDGRIMLKPGDGQGGHASCQAADNIWVESRIDKKGYCFVGMAKSGFLTMEIPDAYAIWTEDRAVRATVTAEGKKKTVDAPKNDVTPVGETDGSSEWKRSVLLELRLAG
ncbi:hypothetical protein ACFU99_23490 [Streptomyces sp. NPDC057654]|uniref:hypothetical protein n=1 Tax=Streptomyces sp. NPDC057654 TaxID=3346196 RepID=UPI00369C23F2